jgi:hypothetical protein
VNHAGPDALGDPSYTQDCAAVIVKTYGVSVVDTSRFGIRRMYPYCLIVIAILDDTMAWNLTQPVSVFVIVSMIREPSMW